MLRSVRLRLGNALSAVALAGLAAATAARADGEHAPAPASPAPAAQADGWLEWGLRGLFSASALVFVAGLVLPRVVGRRGGWPVPDGLDHPLAARLGERRRRIVTDLGWLAVGTGVAAALADAATGPGPRSASATAAALLTGAGAEGRAAMVLALAGAVLTHRRGPRLAAAFGLLALVSAAVAVQGAGAPRAAPVLADALLLSAAVVALGGLGLLLAVWAGPLRRDPALRASARRQVLAPYARAALPAAVVAGVVLAFPPPPGPTVPAQAAGPCSPCPLPAAAPDELAVAANAGSQLVAAWIRRPPGAVTGTVRVLDRTGRPSGLPVRLSGLDADPCGQGCLTFRAPPGTRELAVEVTEDGRRHTARLPARWSAEASDRARRLVSRAQAAMRAITSVREVEEVTSGPGSYARTDYRLRAPDRMAFRTDRGVESVVDGARQWRRVGGGPWEQDEYGSGLGFRTGRWFRWTPYARTARLLAVSRRGGRRVAELALYDETTPVWFRLSVELGTRRVLRERLTARAHYMTARYRAFDRPLRIVPPEAGVGR